MTRMTIEQLTCCPQGAKQEAKQQKDAKQVAVLRGREVVVDAFVACVVRFTCSGWVHLK